MLIGLGGLPGVGKTTIASELARQIGAVHIRIDSIEQAIRESGAVKDNAGYQVAYRVAYTVAEENLRAGRTVITDCVNPISQSRDAWLQVAKAAGVVAIEVEVICSDATEHRRRLETGAAVENTGEPPRWQHVMRNYQPWDRPRVVIDTARQDVSEAVALLRRALVNS